MKRFWPNSSFQSQGLLDTVSGIVKQNATKLTTISTSTSDQKQYLRLPVESARRLRWYDNADLNQIVRTHIREKQELIELNDLLRKILVEKQLVHPEVVDVSMLRRMTDVDESQILNEYVSAALLVSAEEELGVAKKKLQEIETRPASTLHSSQNDDTVAIRLLIDEDSDSPIHVDFDLTKNQDSPSAAILDSLQDIVETLEQHGTENMGVELRQHILDLIGRLKKASFMEELEESRKENAKLQEMITLLKQREKRRQMPSEIVTQAQNMCLEAEEETRAAKRKAETALAQAGQAEEKEKSAVREANELSKKLSLAMDQIKRLKAEHKVAMDRAEEDYHSKVQESETLIQRNISLRNEMDDLTIRASFLDSIVSEKDALASKILSLEDTVTELKVKVSRGEHYKQIANEMEERVAEMEKELLLTAQKITILEKKLRTSEKEVLKEQSRNEKLESKIRKLKTEDAASAGGNSAAQVEEIKQNWLSEIDNCQQELKEARVEIKDLQHKLELEQTEKMKLLKDLSDLEDRFLVVEKNHTTNSVQLRHQLSVARNDMEDCKKYVSQLESQHQSLCTKLHIKPDPKLGFEDSRGGGTFGDVVAMSDVSQRNGLSAIDTLYLKNVLFKFIEATAKQKISERDLLLPAVSTLLGASREEFSQLKKSLADSGKEAKGIFGLWTVK